MVGPVKNPLSLSSRKVSGLAKSGKVSLHHCVSDFPDNTATWETCFVKDTNPQGLHLDILTWPAVGSESSYLTQGSKMSRTIRQVRKHHPDLVIRSLNALLVITNSVQGVSQERRGQSRNKQGPCPPRSYSQKQPGALTKSFQFILLSSASPQLRATEEILVCIQQSASQEMLRVSPSVQPQG